MVEELIKVFNQKGKLDITDIEWDGYNLSILGENWSLNSTSAWRIIAKIGLFGDNDTESKSQLDLLKGKSILEIKPLGDLGLDFSLVLTDNIKIQIFCNTYFEPWIFSFDKTVTFVAAYQVF